MGWFNTKKTSKNNIPKPQTTQKDSSIVRSQSITICLDAGFHPASSLPTIRETKLRPADEIAGRLHAIKALVLWLMVSSENLPDEKIINFINQNELLGYMTPEEKEILDTSRNDIELRNSIGWKFENLWPLAWYFGYDEPEISGQMMTGEQMQEILINHTCSLDTLISDWLPQQHTLEEEKLVEKEDLFYCLHNSVRSAQLGGDTVPNGFDPIGNGGVIHERRHSLTWMLSSDTKWEDTDLNT